MNHPSATSRKAMPARRSQRGTTLLEALIAFLVLALGMLTVTRLQGHLQLGAETARQRSEAVRLAQEDIEILRGFAVIAGASGAAAPAGSFDAIASATRSVDASSGRSGDTRYRIERRVDAVAAGTASAARSVRVTVQWADRAGETRQVVLNTLIAAADPAFSGALSLDRSGAPLRGPFGRSVRIPYAARDLGTGQSAYKPPGSGTVAYLFDNRSGALTARCGAVAAATPTRALTVASLGACTAFSGQWLGGSMRFSSSVPPDPTNANDAPPATAVELLATGTGSAGASSCTTEPMKTVTHGGRAGLRIEAVPIDALPASLGLAAWADTGERFVAWHCAIELAAGARWAGRVAIVPSGWRIGSAAGERRVCRHSSDLDGSGAIDAALEHPAAHSGIATTLRHENFLVVDAGATCPGGREVRVAGNNTEDVHVDLSTAPHAP